MFLMIKKSKLGFHLPDIQLIKSFFNNNLPSSFVIQLLKFPLPRYDSIFSLNNKRDCLLCLDLHWEEGDFKL